MQLTEQARAPSRCGGNGNLCPSAVLSVKITLEGPGSKAPLLSDTHVPILRGSPFHEECTTSVLDRNAAGREEPQMERPESFVMKNIIGV